MDNRQTLKRLYEKRRDQAHRDLEQRKKDIYRFIPKVKSIDDQIRSMGLKVAKAALLEPEKASLELKIIEEEIKVLQRDKRMLLEEQQIPQDYLVCHYQCPVCEDTGFLKNGKPCACYQQERIKLTYKHSNLTDVLQEENFESFNLDLFSKEYNDLLKKSPFEHMTEVKAIALEFVSNFNEKNDDNLLFFGPTGLGKTFLCNCIAKSLLDKGHTVLYQTAFRTIDTISQYRFTNPKTEDMRFNYDMLLQCDLLIIDDLGTEMINSFSNTEWFNIINTRLLEKRKTIISTNFTPQQISENYSDRIASRLFGNYNFIPFIGDDLRWEV